MQTVFQDGVLGGHLVFPIGMIIAIFNLQAASILLLSFESTDLCVQEKKSKTDLNMAAMEPT